MTPKAQQIAIAKAHGYEPDPETGLWYALAAYIISGFNTTTRTIEPLLNYLSDLNAMHEAEKVLSYQQHCHYCDILEMVVGGPAYMPAIRATAAQRAEAFLKTLNLWDDSK